MKCPDVVVLPAGQTSVTFDLEIIDDDLIDGTIPVLVCAAVENWNSAIDSTTVEDNDAVLTVILPPSVWEGSGAGAGIGRIELGGRSSEDLVVTLTSSAPQSIRVPGSVTVEAGQLGADFAFDILDDSLCDGAEEVTVDATAAGIAPDSRSVIVNDDDVDHFEMSPIDDPQMAAEPFDVTITAKNIDGETIETFDTTESLVVTGSFGRASLRVCSQRNGGGVRTAGEGPGVGTGCGR